MFDFNNIIEDNNSKEITDKVFLSMLDIRVLFFNKYNYLIEVENPSDNIEFQKITNIINNTYGDKDNKRPFIMEKQFHLLLEKYFKVIDTKKLYPGYRKSEPYFVNSDENKQIIYTDGIFIIEEMIIDKGSFSTFFNECSYSIKLDLKNNDDIIEKISDLTYPLLYNKVIWDITEGCLNPLNYYNKLLDTCDNVTLDGIDSYMLNYNLLKGTVLFYMDNNSPNKFYFIYDTIYMRSILHKRLVTQNKKLCSDNRFIYLFKFGNDNLYNFIEGCILNREKQTTIAPIYNNSIVNVNIIENVPVYVKLTIDNDLLLFEFQQNLHYKENNFTYVYIINNNDPFSEMKFMHVTSPCELPEFCKYILRGKLAFYYNDSYTIIKVKLEK